MKKIIKGSKQNILHELKTIDDTLNYVLTLQEQRSVDMNSCFQGWCRFIAQETGNEFKDVKAYFLIECGFSELIRTSLNKEKKRVRVPMSSTELSKKDFIHLLNYIEQWATNESIQLPASEHKIDIKLNWFQ